MSENRQLNTLLPKIEAMFELMKADYNKFMGGDSAIQTKMRKEYADSLAYTIGQNYIKITSNNSVRCFIVITHTDKQFPFGTLLKAASWKAPARNFSRGNIFELEKCKEHIRWTGVS